MRSIGQDFFAFKHYIREMKTEDYLSDDLLKQFKTGQQLNDFIHNIQQSITS